MEIHEYQLVFIAPLMYVSRVGVGGAVHRERGEWEGDCSTEYRLAPVGCMYGSVGSQSHTDVWCLISLCSNASCMMNDYSNPPPTLCGEG